MNDHSDGESRAAVAFRGMMKLLKEKVCALQGKCAGEKEKTAGRCG